MDLTNEDVADILALLDSLPYDELDLQTPRFRLTLRRTPKGWTQSTESRVAPTVVDVARTDGEPTTSLPQRGRQDDVVATTTRLGRAGSRARAGSRLYETRWLRTSCDANHDMSTKDK